MKREINNWQVEFFEYNPTYLGLIMGEPNERINDSKIERKIEMVSRKWRMDENDIKNINIIKDYSGYYGGTNDYDKNEFALKPVICFFRIIKYEPKQIMAHVLTFANEDESPEDVVERITKNKKLKTIEWDF